MNTVHMRFIFTFILSGLIQFFTLYVGVILGWLPVYPRYIDLVLIGSLISMGLVEMLLRYLAYWRRERLVAELSGGTHANTTR